MTEKFDGRVGVCAQATDALACVQGEDRFPMQSVVKLVVAVAVLDAVDRGQMRLDDAVVVRKEDLNLGPQPIAKLTLTTPDGYRTTINDLLSRMVTDSDSTAYRILHQRVGGPAAVQAMLDRHQLSGIRSDRDELDMNMEIVGLEWRPQYVEKAIFDKAVADAPAARRQELFNAYLIDPRDTATPKGMTDLLSALHSGRLLSAGSTKRLLEILSRTKTFPDRLQAGLPPGWTLGHKTGTGPTWNGVISATNDVGVLAAPDGGAVAVAVFISGSPRPEKEQAALIADIARKITQSYH
ncbi:MAG: beta-lactamase class [Alphaproteobacteria bacterium]|jgi:beta-lactamase class A|nr:beta-lactamase class [Alphaproteobacteria bacterium]